MQIKSPQILLRTREKSRNRRRMGGGVYCIFKMRANKRFVQGEENTRARVAKDCFREKNIPRNIIVGIQYSGEVLDHRQC